MPGIKIRLSTEEAQAASERLQKTLKALGGQSVLTEKEIKALESRMRDKMQIDGARRAVEQLATATGLTSRELSNLKTKFGEHLTVLERVKAGWTTLKTHWMAITGALVAGYIAVGKAVKYLDMGAEAEQAEQTYAAITESMGRNSDELLQRMRKSSRGMIDESAMMQKAVFALDQEIDPEKIPQLFEAARVASRKTGQDIVTTTDSIIDAIGAGIPRSLKRMGLVTKEQLDLFNRAMAMGIDDVKLLDLVLANTAVSAARFNVEATNSREKMAQFKAAFKDLQEAVGQAGWKFIERGEVAFVGFAGAVTGALAAMKNMRAEGYEKMAKEAGTPEARQYYASKAAELRKEQQKWGEKQKLYDDAYYAALNIERPDAKKQQDPNQYRKNLQDANKLRAAEDKREAEEKKIRDQINEGAITKAHAESIKERNAAEMQASEDSARVRIEIFRNYTTSEAEIARAELDEREALNTEFYNARQKEISAEYNARLVSDKMFKHWAKDWLSNQYSVLDAQMKSRDVMEANARLRIEELRHQEELKREQEDMVMGLEEENKARRDTISALIAINSHTQRMRELEFNHQSRLSGLRARYGMETPREQVSTEYDLQKKKLLSEQSKIRDDIAVKEKLITKGTEEYLDFQREKIAALQREREIEKELVDLEEERVLATREFADDWLLSIDGLVTGIRVYKAQIGSEFQIWEQMSKDTAQAMQQVFSDYFFDILTGQCKSFEDYFKSFAQGLSRALADAFSKKLMNSLLDIGGDNGLSSLLSGGLSFLGIGGGGNTSGWGGNLGGMDTGWGAGGDYTFAKGAAFNRGRVIAFDRGGVVDRPTFFPMAKGAGLMAEAGPEAVMPLTRSSSGHLGVRAVGGGGSLSISAPVSITGMDTSKIKKRDISDLRGEMEDVCEKWMKKRL